MKYYLITNRCTLCGMCVTICPEDAVRIRRGYAEIMQQLCTHCGDCYESCPDDAIQVYESETDPE